MILSKTLSVSMPMQYVLKRKNSRNHEWLQSFVSFDIQLSNERHCFWYTSFQSLRLLFFFAGSTRLQISGVFLLLCQRFCFRFVQLRKSLLWSNSIIHKRTKRPLFLEKKLSCQKNIHFTFLKHRERVFVIRIKAYLYYKFEGEAVHLNEFIA